MEKIMVTLPKELYEMVEQARAVEGRSRSEIIQEALRTYFSGPAYQPTEEERSALIAALETVTADPASLREWADVRETLRVQR